MGIKTMGSDLSFVNATDSGCVIYRETSGRYVVSHLDAPRRCLHAATLAGAYAACRGWESRLGIGSTQAGPPG